MSEWKWCLYCDHHYSVHLPTEEKLAYGGPCTVEGCLCQQFEQEVANFL